MGWPVRSRRVVDAALQDAMATTTTATPRGDGSTTPSLTAPGLFLGLGLGGLLDGIVLHQILRWHHMGTDHGVHASFPLTTVPSLEDNMLWDGLFQAGAWILTLLGLYLLWAALRNGTRAGYRSLTGLLLAGWGMFNLAEGIVDHLILGIHHVRDDLGGPLSWDLGFLAFGALLVIVGGALVASGHGGGVDAQPGVAEHP